MVPGERAAGSAYSFGAGAGGPEGGAQPRPHSSGFRTFLNWFRRAEVTRRGAEAAAGEGDAALRPRTPEPDSDDDSTDSETSTATAASFAFLPPAGYRPYGDALEPHKYIASGPYTDTYRRRVAERERRRRLDSGVTLRKKYHLPGADATLAPLRETHSPDPLDYDTFSLPAMSRRAPLVAPEHRRAASETKFVRPVSYVHVKGKRRAPPPPAPAAAAATPLSATLTRRVKRLAPRPPAPAADPDPTKLPLHSASPERARAVVSESSERPASPSAPLLCEQPLPGGTVGAAAAPEAHNPVQPTAPPLTKLWLATSQTTKIDPPGQGESSSPVDQRAGEGIKPLLLHSKSEESWKPPATTKETGELSPRPWYKRQFSENKTKTKSEDHKQRSKPELPEIGFFRYSKLFDSKKNSTSPKSEEKRFSHALPNISELDREAAEILQMHKKSTLEENNNIGNDVNAAPSFANPRSARLLISKFNELNKGKTSKGGEVKNHSENRPTFQQKISQASIPVEAMKETDNMQSQAVPQEGKLKSGDDTWVCMRCEKRNNCKKIICSSCFSRKPKDDDLFAKHIKQDLLKSFESEVLDALSHLGNMNKNNIDDNKNFYEQKEAVVPLESEKLAKDKMEEQKKLRQILKEMKNSLPKEPKENSPDSGMNNHHGNAGPSSSKEDVKVDNPNPSNQKVIVVNVLTKTDNDVVTHAKIGGDNKNESEIPKKDELCKTSSFTQAQINPLNPEKVNTDFPPLNNIEDSLYANVRVPIPTTKSQTSATAMVKSAKLLLKELEAAIGKGDDQAAAEVAKRLAQMKVNCTVVSSNATLVKPQDDQDVDVEVYVEDAESAAGPVRLRVRRSVTLPQLRAAAAQQLGVPSPLQRWIVGKRLCVEDAPLSDYNDGDFSQPLFLYVVSPAKVEGDVKSDVKVPPVTKENAEKATKSEVGTESVSVPEAANTATTEVSANSQNNSNNLTKSSTTVEVTQNLLTKSSKNSKDASTTSTSSNTSDFTKNLSAGSSTNSKYDFANPGSLNASDATKRLAAEPTTSSKITEIKPTESSASTTKALPSEGLTADHYQQLVQLESQELIPNAEQFACGVCLEPCAVGAGAMLRECLHTFCRECLADTVRHCDAAQVVCPYRDAQYSCESALQHREVRALVSAAEYERRLARSVQLAERNTRGAFHCKTADCGGWCVYENAVNEFRCPVCRCTNCLTCQVIHTGENCAEYQARIRREAEGAGSGAAEAERTRRALEEMCARGDALACPTCQVVLMKKWGCDWVRCSMCKTEICWVTRGARWGPAGRGDTSAGCRCGVGGVKCHPSCNYCH